MSINEQTLKLIVDHIETSEIEIDDMNARISIVISAPIVGQEEERCVQLSFDILPCLDFINEEIIDALADGEYCSLSLTGGDYTVKELEEIALLIKLAA